MKLPNAESHAQSQATLRYRLDRSFWTKVTREGDCWIWQGQVRLSRRSQPYGVLARFNRRLYAHRYAYELVKGPIPVGLVVMHSCDRPLCVNPGHLSVGTQADNVADAKSKGRVRTRALRGEAANGAVLTQVAVREMRDAARRDGTSHRALAAMYGVTKSTVTRALAGQSWKESV